jgi:hypothetical protein
MTTLHEQARAEAEKRYPEPNPAHPGFIEGFLAGHETATADDDARITRLVGVVTATTMLGPQDAETVVRALVAHAAARTRVVTTVDELDALPVGSVVLDRLLMPWHKRPGTRWYSTGWDGGVRSPAIALPARVLYDPEDAYADAARIAGEGR